MSSSETTQNSDATPSWQATWLRFLLIGTLVAMGVLTGLRLLDYESDPWAWVSFFAGFTVLIFGPLTWFVRDRIGERRRRNLLWGLVVVCLLLVPFLVALALLSGHMFWMDTLLFGVLIGIGIVAVLSRTDMPEGFRRDGS